MACAGQRLAHVAGRSHGASSSPAICSSSYSGFCARAAASSDASPPPVSASGETGQPVLVPEEKRRCHRQRGRGSPMSSAVGVWTKAAGSSGTGRGQRPQQPTHFGHVCSPPDVRVQNTCGYLRGSVFFRPTGPAQLSRAACKGKKSVCPRRVVAWNWSTIRRLCPH